MMKAAIFDVDGTLLDSMGIWEDAGARYLRNTGYCPEENLGTILFSMTIEEGAVYMKDHYALPRDVPEIIQGVLDTVREFYYREAPLKEGAKCLLARLFKEGLPMAAATSSEKDHIETAFKRLGIRAYFKEIVTCSEVGQGKTKPLVYQTACKYLGENAAETYVFEDALYALQTAKAAGFCTVGVYDRYSAVNTEEIKRQADIYLPDYTEYEAFLRTIRTPVESGKGKRGS